MSRACLPYLEFPASEGTPNWTRCKFTHVICPACVAKSIYTLRWIRKGLRLSIFVEISDLYFALTWFAQWNELCCFDPGLLCCGFVAWKVTRFEYYVADWLHFLFILNILSVINSWPASRISYQLCVRKLKRENCEEISRAIMEWLRRLAP